MKDTCGAQPVLFETLEARLLLSSTTFTLPCGAEAKAAGGNLIVKGGGEDDCVLIRQVGEDAYRVSCCDDGETTGGTTGGTTGTTTTGETTTGEYGARTRTQESGFIFTGVTKDIKVNLGNGDDTLTLEQMTAPRNVKINTDGGDDVVQLLNVEVLGKTTIDGGDGNDLVAIDPSYFEGRVTIETGGGDDHVDIYSSHFYDRFDLDAGDGNDTLDLSSGMYYEGSFAGPTYIQMDNGNDDVNISDQTFSGSLLIDLNAGNDDLRTTNVTTGPDMAVADGNVGYDTYRYENGILPNIRFESVSPLIIP